MKAVSEVIAIILILMITISLAGLAYMFMSTTMSDVTSSAGSTVDTTTSSMLTSFTIESMDVAKVYVRNTGQNAITSLSVYVNDEPATIGISPASISAGSVGTITIYSFIPDGATVKVVSPNGFSTSKVSNPCSKAVGCWKFEEGTGTAAYDSSTNENTGTLTNGPTWTSGMHGSAITFDGTNDYVNAENGASLNFAGSGSISTLIKLKSIPSASQTIVDKYKSASDAGVYLYVNNQGKLYLDGRNNAGVYKQVAGNTILSANVWHYVAAVSNSTHWILYVDGVQDGIAANGVFNLSHTYPLNIGYLTGGVYYFNGTIDEVRIYNRAIY